MNIIGKSECTASQMAQYLINLNSNAKSWALEYAKLYLEEGEVEGIRGDGAWIQSCKETGNFKFTGGTAVTFDQNNFCGLGVTRKGLKGHSFDTPRLGIRAQIQHLKGYATTALLKNPCIDPRYKYVAKGCAPRFEDLTGKWAVPGYDTSKASSLQDAINKGIGYGFDIVAGIQKMKSIKVVNDPTSQTSQQGVNKITYTNSPLITYTKISPNSTNPRNNKIKKITIHHMAGNLSVEQCGNVFQNRSRQASSNYGIGTDGRIGLYVEEKNRAWTSGNKDNDNQAITIEVANDVIGGNWHVSDKALESLINLCVDICKRNGITKLNFTGDKNGNLTMHKYFQATQCPGEYLASKFPYIADEVNKKLGMVSSSTQTSPTTSTSTASTYTVVKGDTLSKIGQKTGIAWTTIADLNGIKSPYTIKVGQVLKLANPTNSTASHSNGTPTISAKKYIYNGVDYSPIFSPTYYANKYPDLKKAFGTNATALFDHFIKFGVKEKRQASAAFNVEVYKNNYVDLQKTFGDNYPEYYKHYIQFGKKEGRKAV